MSRHRPTATDPPQPAPDLPRPAPGGQAGDLEPRCWNCNRMLARQVTRPWHIDCPRCRRTNRRGFGNSPTAV